MFLNAVAIGLGFFTPVGNLSTVCPTGKEIRIVCEFPIFHRLEITNFKLLNFTKDDFKINVFQITEGTKFKVYKKVHLNLGFGGYYIRKTSGPQDSANSGFESSYGTCSYLGFHIPIEFGSKDSEFLIPEISYYSIPKGISLTLNIGINL